MLFFLYTLFSCLELEQIYSVEVRGENRQQLLSGKVITAENVLVDAEAISRKKHEQNPGEGLLWLQQGIMASQWFTYRAIWNMVFNSV